MDKAARLDASDSELVAALKRRDESAFTKVVTTYHGALMRLALVHYPSRALAEEIVQETWLAVLQGIDRFEGRSSFKTWLFRILLNRARTASYKEQRAGRPDEGLDERFDDGGHWAEPPEPWAERVDDRLVATELAERVRGLLPLLPDAQRQVVVLRDVEGLSATEVCDLLRVKDGQQRVLLHRGRARLRALL